MKPLMIICFLSICFQPLIAQTQIGSDIPGASASDQSGRDIALNSNGNRIIIGSFRNDGSGLDAGHARVFEYNGSNWSQIGNDIDGEATGDFSGAEVAISGDGNRVVIGAPFNDANGEDSGHARVFDLINGNWMQAGNDIDGVADFDNEGESLAISADGNRIAIGTPYNDTNGTSAGHVRVFDWINGNWTQIGVDLNGTNEFNNFGQSVSLSSSGNRLAIGAPFFGDWEGQVKVFEWNGDNWIQLGSSINGEAADEQYGSAISLSPNGIRLAIGSPSNSGETNGYVKVLEWTGSNWIQKGAKINGGAAFDLDPTIVALSPDGTSVIIGMPFDDTNMFNAGMVRIYKELNGNWSHVGNDILGMGISAFLGEGIAISSDGSRMAVGEPTANGNNPDDGIVRVYDLPSVVAVITLESEYDIDIFPNPVVQKINLSNSDYDFVKIIDNFGKTVFEETIPINEIDVTSFVAGIYYLQIKTGDELISKKIIKQ